jgi:diguanylate cyclase (GGDEF)-like protein/PAS domain S-box-containing protein
MREKPKVLVVDDDQRMVKTVCDVLKVKGYEVLTAENGAQGLALLGENPVDLVLIDIGLPDIPGLAVLDRVRTGYPATEAIILTGSATLDSAIEATNRGAFSYLIKPYEIEQLLLQIRRATETQKAREALREALQAQESRSAELAAANRALEAEIAERERTEQALRRLNRTLRLFSACNDALVHAAEESELLDGICRKIAEIGGNCLAWVGYAERQRELYPVAHALHEGDGSAMPGNGCGKSGKGACPLVAAVGTESSGVGTILPLQSDASWLVEEALRVCPSAIALPLKENGAVFGSLNIHAAEPEGFGTEEIELFTELANNLSFGILSLRTGVERRRAEDALRQRQRAIESSSNGILITDANQADNPIVYVNPAFEQITGFTAQEVLGHNPRFLLGDDREQLGLEEIRAALRVQGEGHAVLRNYRKDGSPFWNELSLSPVRDESGRVTNFVGILNDITERKRYEEQLEFQANHDGLTGLPNRNLLVDRISQALSYASRYRQQAAVLFVDLDHFKFINDSLGHDAGDRLLKIAAERIRQCVRAIDTVARQGGDEFVVVLPDLTKGEDAADLARRIQYGIGQPFAINGHDLVVTCSTGISIYPKDGEDAQTLLKNADAAMYRAKEQGRNNFQFYTGEMNDSVVARMTMEKHLRLALERDEFVLHYQPQVDLATGRITGMESLIRWQSPELGPVPPVRFIPLAEETGLIVPIGEWVLRTSCRQNKAWQDAGLPPLVVAVNLSPRQFRQEGLCGTVARVLEESGLAPRYLEIEIIESLVMHDVERVTAILKELKGLGVQLTMDDFGTGYSSLGYLKRFPFDKLKIDQSFVRDITSNPDSAVIARVIIAMARNFNLRVIAEGVETAEQLSYLRYHDCEEIQGFYFSRPLPAEAFEQLLREGRQLELPVEEEHLPEKTLLVVDDEPHVTAALRRLFTFDGYSVLAANNIEEAFQLLATNRIGIVVCDLRMPAIDGIEFLSRVKEIYPDIVRVVLTGYADLDSAASAINSGAVYKFLTKPWEEAVLRETIRESFRYYARNAAN